ncbi:MAG: acylphosphatase [bacterium]
MKRAHVLYAGRVQGVGFRFNTVEIANRYGIVGLVKNCGDGRVEVVAEGTEPSLQSFLDELNASMSQFIRDRQISWAPASNQFSSFQINY